MFRGFLLWENLEESKIKEKYRGGQFYYLLLVYIVYSFFYFQDICVLFYDEGDFNSSCGIDLKLQLGIVQLRQGGVIRKVGWLFVKYVFVRVKISKVEQVLDRKWRKCWVLFKSGVLNFYFCNEKIVSFQDLDELNFLLEIDGCVV